jgi:hypothetical protein
MRGVGGGGGGGGGGGAAGGQLCFLAHSLGAFLGPAVLGGSVHLFGLEAAAYTYGMLAVAAGVAVGWYARKTASLDDETNVNASALVDFQLLFAL